jgi:hypothetical protein
MPPPSLLSAASRPPSTAPPLSHHDILGLVEPFSRAGLKLDLSASDRMARKLVFRPAPADAERPASEPLPSSLDALPAHLSVHLFVHYQLDLAEAKRPELTRHLCGPPGSKAGMTARLQARGGSPAELLACIQAVPAQQQWLEVGQATVVLSHRIELPRAAPGAAAGTSAAPTLVLTDALVRVAGCRLHMRVPRVPGMPAELELSPADAPPASSGPALSPARRTAAAARAPEAPEPPPDLLAVLGLRWSRLSRVRGSWRSTVQLSRREPARSADALAKLLQAVAHLGQTLAEPPSRFHQRFTRARWAVTLRRATPLTVALGLIAAAAAVPVLDLGEGSVLRMLIFNSPPLLMVWMFALREFPRIELPPLPRVPAAGAWTALVSAPGRMPIVPPATLDKDTASDPPAFNPLSHQPRA